MTGTIMISAHDSVDVRTVDFMRIVKALRSRIQSRDLAAKLLSFLDNGGINMILADDLDAVELSAFEGTLEQIELNDFAKETEFASFIRAIRERIKADPRLDCSSR